MPKQNKDEIKTLSQIELVHLVNNTNTELSRLKRNYNHSLTDNKKLRDDIKELRKEIREYKNYFTPYAEFFDYVKIRVDKMIEVSEFATEWLIFKKGLAYWERKFNGESDKDITGSAQDLIDYYENE